MKKIDCFINEKLKLNINSKMRKYSDEELLKDYDDVWCATTKKEKQVIAYKYGITDIRIRPIQLGILDILRKNRHSKKEFDFQDARNFFKYDIPDTYNKFAEYLKEEPKEFIEWLLQRYEEKVSNLKRPSGFGLSGADRHTIKIRDNLKKFLNI